MHVASLPNSQDWKQTLKKGDFSMKRFYCILYDDEQKFFDYAGPVVDDTDR